MNDKRGNESDDIGSCIDQDKSFIECPVNDFSDGLIKNKSLKESSSSVLCNAVKFCHDFIQFLPEVITGFSSLSGDVVSFHDLKDFSSSCAAKRISAVGGSVIAGYK